MLMKASLEKVTFAFLFDGCTGVFYGRNVQKPVSSRGKNICKAIRAKQDGTLRRLESILLYRKWGCIDHQGQDGKALNARLRRSCGIQEQWDANEPFLSKRVIWSKYI